MLKSEHSHDHYCTERKKSNGCYIEYPYSVVNSGIRSPTRSNIKMFTMKEKERGLLPSFTCPYGHNLHVDRLRPPPTKCYEIRPSSCKCPHGNYPEEKVIRPASCPHGRKIEKKEQPASYTCPYGHTHGPTICPRPKPIPNFRALPAADSSVHKRKFYSINAPQEPLILNTNSSTLPPKASVVSSQDNRTRTWTEPPGVKKQAPFYKSYKHVNIPPFGSRINWNDYHRLSTIHEFLESLECAHPSLCSVAVIGRSLERRDIKVLKISNSNANNCGVWMDAGIHAREWIGPAVNTYVANYLASHFKSLPSFVTNKDWFFLPVANPDGYEYTHTTDRMWRKNKACINGKCVGVDLNRNFSFGWGGQGSSDNPHNSFYRGTKAFSEPESCAIRDFLSCGSTAFRVYITLHSYGEVIIFPFADHDNLCPGYIRLLQGATVMSKAIHRTNGRVYKVGISKDMMYRASGTSNDWSHGVVGIPYCYLIELRSKKDRMEDYSYKNSKCRFKVPCEEIEETGNEILNSMFALMEFIDSYPEDKLIAENPIYALPKREEGARRSLSIKPNFKQTSKTHKKIKTLQISDSRFKMVPPVKVYSDTTQVWEVKIVKDQQRKFIKALDTEGAVNIWREEPHTMDILVEGNNLSSVSTMLIRNEIQYSVVISNVYKFIEVRQAQTIIKDTPRMSWTRYHRLDTIYQFMDDLAKDYPEICSVQEIGKSVEGRPIMMLKVSNGNNDNDGVWIDGAIHAREWITPAVVTYIADRITRNFKEQPDYITNKDWYFLPVVNPDGYEFSHTNDRMWRKNRSITNEKIGVDLNRNFSYGWGKEEGSSDEPGNVFFRGPKPFSEPESQAIRYAIMTSGANFKVFISLHSYGEVIIFPWGFTEEACPDYVELLEGGTAMSRAIHETSGRTYKVGSTKDLMYFAAGTSIDWSYGEINIPYSYMIELRDKKHRFLLPSSEILDTSIEIYNGVAELMRFVDRKPRNSPTVSGASLATSLSV